ncbi:hypothetical protein HJA89_00475 [Rhizobium bangladeshense]|uniref:hypothetical protein n=1 Tax=Rhizobium bangladeshense TaxID=1138189 RepID=UPI001C837812|nr:hypothetical protein [Rhizobium bangladeshense]MBX4871400.1 hypothetical protein [Rhizobium bangladeshense]MBX4882714.1 hypothetical protein [Rhizobium bangladeshense]
MEPANAAPYSQLITLYLAETWEPPDILESASRLAAARDTYPYSFVHVSGGGQQPVVLVDPHELDKTTDI